MKKRLLSVALLMGTMAANAQVGIGTATPNKSAELLIESKNRGLLIPNVALVDTKDKTTITNGNVQSLLVYATKTQNDITPGYYYWDINKWARLTADADIPGIVINKFGDILKGGDVTNLIKNIVKTTEGNVIYEGNKLYHITKEGDKVEISFDGVVKAHETLTVLAFDKTTGGLTYSDEKNKVTTIDIKGAVKSFETVTSIVNNADSGTLTFKDEAGKETVISIKDLVKKHETVTTLVREKAGKYVYTNEAGTSTDITVIGDITEVIKNKTDQDLYNVLKQLVNVEQTLTKLVYNTTNRQLAYTDEQNTTHNIDVDALVKENQTVTTLNGGANIKVTEIKGANSISYTLDVPTATKDVAGVVKPGSGLDVDADGNLTVNLETALNGKDLTGNEKIVVTDGKGAVLKTTKLDINEGALSLQNIGGTLNLTQLQKGEAGDVLVIDATGNVVWSAKDAITTNSLVLNGTDLTSTVNGVSSTQTLKDKLTTEMLQNGSVTADKLGAGEGNEGKVPVAQADGTVVYQNISSANVDGKALTSANNLLSVSVEAGVVLKDVQLTVNQDKFDLAKIGGILQLTQIQKGEIGSVLVTDKDGTVKWVKEDATIIKDLVKANETITTIVDNGNGTFTYFNEADYGKDGVLKPGAVGVIVDTNKTTVDVKDGIYTFKDGNKNIITTINTNAIATGYDNGKSGLTSKDVQGAIDELVNKIKTVENTKGNLTGKGIVVSTSEGVVLKNVELSIEDGAITTDKLASGAVTTDKLNDGAVTTEKISAGNDGEVLVTVVENGKTVTKWVSKTAVTTNTLTKKDGTNGNTIVSTVNGVPAELALIDKVETKVDGTTINTVVNGVESGSVDLTTAIEAGQKTTSVEKGSDKVSVVGTTTGKNTEYVVDVNEANLSLQNIGGQVTNNQIQGGNDGEVLVTVVENGKTVTKWVTRTAATTNELTSTDNTMTSNVNGVSKTADIINSVENKLNRDNQLITVVNGVEGDALDLTSAITTGQLKTTVSAQDEKVTVNSALDQDGKTTNYVVGVDEAKLSLQNIGGQVTNNQIQGGKEGDVLVSVKEGDKMITKWVTKTEATTNDLKVVGNELVSTVNGQEAKTDLTNKISNEMLQGGSVTSDKLSAGKGDDNRVAVADGAGNVTYKTQKEIVEGNTSNNLKLEGNALTSTVNGKPSTVNLTDANIASTKGITGTGITINGGASSEGSTLQDVTLAITPGTEGQVMVTGQNGETIWVNQNDIVKNNTTNELTSTDNTMTSNVNGVSKTADIINSVENKLNRDNQLITVVNGVEGDALDLTSAITTGQLKTTVSAQDEKVIVNSALDQDGKTTNYVVGVDEAKLSLQNIGGQVTNSQIQGGNDGEVLVTVVENGKTVTKWVSKTAVTTNTLTKKDGTNGNTIVSTVNGVPAELVLIDKVETKVDGTTINTVVNGVESGSVDLTTAIEAGQKTTSVEKGSDKLSVVGTTTGKNTEYVVDVNEGNLSLQNIGGQVTNNQIQGGKEGDVLVSTVDAQGKPITKWVTKTDATTNDLKVVGNELVSTVNGQEAKADLKDKISNEMLQGGSVTSDKLSAGKGDDNRVAVADGAGNVTYKTQKEIVEGNTSNELKLEGNALTSTVNGKTSTVNLTDANIASTKGITGTGITINGGASSVGSTLQDVTLAITPGKEGQVMVTSEDGKSTIWVNQNDIVKNNTSNELTSIDNTMTSNVNGVSKSVEIVNSIENSLDKDNKLVTTVNGKAGEGLDLTSAITTGQLKTTVSAQDEKITVTSALEQDGKTTNYVVGVDETKLDLGKMDGEVTNTQIANGAVTTEKIKAGEDGEVLVTVVENGKTVTKWVTKTEATTNVLTTDGNTLKTIVNGVSSQDVQIVKEVKTVLGADNKLVTSVNGIPSEGLDLTGKINKDMLADKAVTKEKIAEDVAGEGLVKNTTTGALDVNAGNGIKIVDDKVTVNAGTGLSFDKEGKLNVDFPTATKDVAGVVKPGKGLDVTADGTLSVNYETAKTELAKGKVTSSSIVVNENKGSEGSTFKDVSLEIKGGANKGDVLVTGDNGKVEWVTKTVATSNELSSTGNIMTSNVNGVSKDAKIVNSITNTLNDKNELVTTVNGESTKGIDLTSAVQAGQKTTVVVAGNGVTVSPSESLDKKVTTYTVSADSSTITLDGDVKGTADNTTISKLQGKELDAKDPQAGNVLVFEGGKWITKAPSVNADNVTNEKALTSTQKTIDISVNGATSLLKDVQIDVANGAINKDKLADNAVTSEKIKDGEIKTVDLGDKVVTPGKVEGGKDGEVLTTTGTGENVKVEWKKPVVDAGTVTNGQALTSTQNTIAISGNGANSLLKDVQIDVADGAITTGKIKPGKDNQVLTTVGTGDQATVVWKDKEKPTVIKGGDSTTSNVVVTPGTGANGEKEYTVDVKSAMPKVFYMPPVMFDTSKTGKGKSRNLYNEYKAMFTGSKDAVVDTPMTGTRPEMVKSDVNATIPVYKAEELNFFIPYYDPAVFANVKVDAQGNLTYDILKKAKYGAFMTVVFVVK